MKTRLHKRFIAKTVALFIVLLPVTLVSCVKEDSKIQPPEKSGNTTITFDLKVPAEDKSTDKDETQTRTLTSTDENEVRNAVVIAFKDDKYYYRAVPKEAITNNTFKVDLIEGTYDIMVLANYSGKPPVFSPTQSKQDVLDALTITLKDASDNRWIADPTDANYIPTPMASLIKREEIAGTVGLNKKSATLYRMLAKVNVSVKDVVTNFTLNSVYLYNVNKVGRMVPLFDVTDYKTNIPSQTKILGPVPYESIATQGYPNEIYLFEALNHDADASGAAVLPSDERTCLVVGGKFDGGTDTRYYRIDFSNKEGIDMNYYNIVRNHIYQVNITKVTGGGFDNKEDAFNSAPIDMEVKIQAWNTGETTHIETDGVYSLGVSEKSVEHTSAALVGNTIKVRSDYPYGIKINVSASATDPAITTGVEWLTNAKLTYVDVSGGLSNYTLSYDISKNDTGAIRTGYIHITAGIIDLVVKVTQDKTYLRIVKKEGETWVEVNSLIFTQDSKDHAATVETYRIEWSPTTTNLALSLTPEGGDFRDINWLTGPLSKGSNIDDPQGMVEFEIQPDKIVNYERGSFVEAQTTLNLSLFGESITKTLVLRQFVKDILIESSTEIIAMDGTTETLTVKSNVPWALYANKNINDIPSNMGIQDSHVIYSIKSDTYDDLLLKIPGGDPKAKTEKIDYGVYNLPDGAKISVVSKDDIHYLGLESFHGALGLYAEVTETPTVNYVKTIICASGFDQLGREANCYVLNPEYGMGITIPVRAANGVISDGYITGNNLYNGGVTINPNTIPKGSTYGVRLVWADDCGSDGKGLSIDGVVSKIVAYYDIPDDIHYLDMPRILVLPGITKKEGNAVVAVTRNADGTGDILWSWHIWVTKGMEFEGGIPHTMQTNIMPGHDGAGPLTEYWLDRNLGALNNGGVGKTDIYTYGMHYQWGRKDPFPGANKVDVTATGRLNERQLYDADGPIPMGTNPHGCVNYVKSGTTVEISIKTPLTFYFNNLLTTSIDRYHWLTTSIHSLWGMAHEEGAPGQPTDYYGKSIFDPCPAGYRVPVGTNMTWNNNSNTKHWGNETTSIHNAIGNPVGSVEANHGFQWPSSTPYKGGWYPVAGHRYEGGLHTNIGENGYYWASSSKVSSGSYLGINKTSLIPSHLNVRYTGFPVRCVAQ